LIATLSSAQAGDQWTNIHRQDDAKWASLNGLSSERVRQIRLAGGITDDLPMSGIDNLDAQSLALRKQVLLVTWAGNGHCLKITVLAQRASRFQKIWRATQIAGRSGFCHNGAASGDFTVEATKEGLIIVHVPKDMSGNEIFGQLKEITYRWNGRRYATSQQSKY